MLVGTLSTVTLIWFSPTIQVDILKHESALFPLRNPGLVTIPLSFAVAVGLSLARPARRDEQQFELAAQLDLGGN
jgi:cation/acetate symporter